MSTSTYTGSKTSATQFETDRRRTARSAHVAPGWLWSPTATSSDERIEVSTLNLNRHGVGFEICKPLPVGTYYMIEITMGTQRVTTEVRILSCRPSDAGLYAIGAGFC